MEMPRQQRSNDSNAREIEALNQRGGRMLSIIDLIRAGTLDIDTATRLFVAVRVGGASFLCCALESGAGKTALMGALLGLLPGTERIITVDGPDVLATARAAAASPPACLLVHEIGQGRWHGYLWGPPVLDLARVAGTGGLRAAATIHADTLDQVVAAFASFGGGVADVARFDLVIFITRGRDGRRVSGPVLVRSGDGFHDGFPAGSQDGGLVAAARDRLAGLDRAGILDVTGVARWLDDHPLDARGGG